MLVDQRGDGVWRAHGEADTVMLVIALLELARGRTGRSLDEASVGWK
jgi:hypothetical protein